MPRMGRKGGLVELPTTPAPRSFLPPSRCSASTFIRAELSVLWV